MNKAVEEYVQARRQKIAEDARKKVNAILANDKVVDEAERVYAKPGTSATSAAYMGYTQSDNVDGELRYYKTVSKPINAGPEECKAVEDVLRLEREFQEGVFSEKTPDTFEVQIQPTETYEPSTVCFAFKAIAFTIWIGGFLAAIFLSRDYYDDFSFGLFLAYVAGFGYAGLMPYALSKIMEWMETIARQTSGMKGTITPLKKKAN